MISDEYSSIKVGDDVFVTVGNDIITLVDASDVFATDFEAGETFLLTEKGAVTVGGKIFELTERVKRGVTITGTADGFTAGSSGCAAPCTVRRGRFPTAMTRGDTC